ncbi:transporter substrate-binding domain-containing protein [Limnobacter litoralis]|uniref:Amino acid ABC transporter substrate-binding protein n=1 Tax=Limnobacter litoralis TaxID=481366 RepID=A0ABQ5YUL8_9BURK|nr:transporter substrate-binding domain-containing protein [Limnobacter litoralis]GLR27505.1 amino acid ABC transporter substrate-binding protein [Limnobacter litoralis]
MTFAKSYNTPRSLFISALTSLLLLFCSTSQAQNNTMVIGTKIAPPFVMQNADGELTGISIDLWKKMAKDMGLQYRFEKRDLAGLITGLQDGSLDASIAALTITPKREKVIDFSHPYYTTGLAIATTSAQTGLWATIRRLFSSEFLYAISGLAALLLLVGLLLWLAERKKNAEQFGGTPAQGLGASFWWAAVTMTTVGYGDKAPVTLLGRIIGLIWMFAAIILISSFTAAIATSLTVNQLSTKVHGLDDLQHVRVMAVKHSSASEFLTHESIRFKPTDNLNEAMQALVNNKTDAVVYDAPLMQYLGNTAFKGQVQVLPDILRREDYGVALPAGSKLRERLNLELLQTIGQDDWQDVLKHYLGE